MFTGQITRNKGFWQGRVFTRGTTFSLLLQSLAAMSYLEKGDIVFMEVEEISLWIWGDVTMELSVSSTVITEHQRLLLAKKTWCWRSACHSAHYLHYIIGSLDSTNVVGWSVSKWWFAEREINLFVTRSYLNDSAEIIFYNYNFKCNIQTEQFR